MKLKKYDGKRVRITTSAGEIFEGVCEYADREYNEVLYDRDEESLQMPYFTFFKKEIKKIEELPDSGVYGGYSGKYGLLEEYAVRDGAVGIDEVLLSEQDEHIYRLLLCIEDHLDLGDAGGLPPRDELIDMLRSVPEPESEKTALLLEKLIEKLTQ